MHKLMMTAVLLFSLVAMAAAQNDPKSIPTASCSFQDGKQITVRYTNETSTSRDLPSGKVWTPGGQPMLLFTEAPLVAGNTDIPMGAYSMYIVREKDDWTLVVNKNVSTGNKYDKHLDVVRMGMLMGQLSEPQKEFTVLFGHTEPKQCNMRIYYGKSGTWAEFNEK
jgi:Protein of unknown function (DUF2911)